MEAHLFREPVVGCCVCGDWYFDPLQVSPAELWQDVAGAEPLDLVGQVPGSAPCGNEVGCQFERFATIDVDADGVEAEPQCRSDYKLACNPDCCLAVVGTGDGEDDVAGFDQ